MEMRKIHIPQEPRSVKFIYGTIFKVDKICMQVDKYVMGCNKIVMYLAFSVCKLFSLNSRFTRFAYAAIFLVHCHNFPKVQWWFDVVPRARGGSPSPCDLEKLSAIGWMCLLIGLSLIVTLYDFVHQTVFGYVLMVISFFLNVYDVNNNIIMAPIRIRFSLWARNWIWLQCGLMHTIGPLWWE